MTTRKIVSMDEWEAARQELLVVEKAATRARARGRDSAGWSRLRRTDHLGDPYRRSPAASAHRRQTGHPRCAAGGCERGQRERRLPGCSGQPTPQTKALVLAR